MLLKIGICDDESEYTTILADYLKTYDIDSEKDYSFQIDKFTSAKELLSAYTKYDMSQVLYKQKHIIFYFLMLKCLKSQVLSSPKKSVCLVTKMSVSYLSAIILNICRTVLMSRLFIISQNHSTTTIFA